MGVLESILLAVHVLVALVVIGLVLLQHGKGADMGAAFGSGSSGSLFGAAGSANFLSRSTAVLATVFFLSSLGLTYLGSTRSSAVPTAGKSIMDTQAPKAGDVPAVPAAPTGGAPAAPAPAQGKAGEVPK